MFLILAPRSPCNHWPGQAGKGQIVRAEWYPVQSGELWRRFLSAARSKIDQAAFGAVFRFANGASGRGGPTPQDGRPHVLYEGANPKEAPLRAKGRFMHRMMDDSVPKQSLPW